MRTESEAKGMPSWGWGMLAAMATLMVYLPALRFPFFPFWDDDIHVHSNPHLVHLTWSSLQVFWSGPWQQLYIPLTYSTWAGLAALSRGWDGLPVTGGELNAIWFHGANVLAHTVSTALAFVLLRRTGQRFFPEAKSNHLNVAAALGAVFFALHPLQVESVAWISGLRDVLGGCLGLGALVVLLGGDKAKVSRYAAATLLFIASLAAKPAGVALPVVAAILAVFPFGWKWPRLARELGPWLAIGLVWVVLTSSAQWAAELANNLVPLGMRPLVAIDALAFYLGKTFWPLDLSADYGRAPNIAWHAGWLWWTWLGPAALAAALLCLKTLRIYLVPLGIFAAALLPTLGLVPFNFQLVSTVADRYAYFALLGPALALSLAVLQSGRAWAPAAATVLVAGLAFLTVERLPLWSEDLKLFADTLKANPQSWKAKHNYASALDDRGRTAEAEPLMREVIASRPDSSEAYNDLGVILWKLGRKTEAAETMENSLEVRPTAGTAGNLATMQAQLGNQAGQIAALRRAIKLDPEDALRTQQLIWALATSQNDALRNGTEAIALARHLTEKGPATAQTVLVLIAAQAENGQYADAKNHVTDLLQQLEATGDPLAATIRRDILPLLEAGRPIRASQQ
ncbi:MAG: tetratricopeptide repeat protein [Chthoniobacterales bacterium]